jgi:TatD DNase family protein
MSDAHCHLQDLENFDISDLKYVICAGFDIKSSKRAIEIAQEYPNVWATVGIHPESNDSISEIKDLVGQLKVIAIGECGLDSGSPQECELLQRHLDLAKEFDLPLVIHNRNQDQKILEILGSYTKVMLHCFTSNQSFANECIKRGWYISFGGILTFNKSEYLREIAKQVPEDLLLIETDSPYLSPEPNRGMKNHPNNVKIIAQLLANLRNTSINRIEEITDRNTETLFKIPHPA